MTEFERGRKSGIISGLRMAIVAISTLEERNSSRELKTASNRRVRTTTYRLAVRELHAWLAIELRGRRPLWNRKDIQP